VNRIVDRELLAQALVTGTRDVAKKHWPWLKGDGWPAYVEGRKYQVLLVNELVEAVADLYETLPDAEELDPGAEWNWPND
jgi:hypothetical protein